MSEKQNRLCIVVDRFGPFVLHLCAEHGYPRAGVLMHGDNATLFPNRQRARRAIRRSTEWATERGFRWSLNTQPHTVRIVNVDPLVPTLEPAE